MDIKKNRGWVVLLLVLVIWEIITIASIKSQNENLERQINNMANNIYDEVSSIDASVYEIKREISEELEKQTSIISSYAIEISFIKGMLNIDLSFIPKEYRDDEEVEVVFSSDKETKVFSAINKNGIFIVKGELLPSEKNNATIRFISGEITRQEKLPDVDAADELAFEYDAYLLEDRQFYEGQGSPTEAEVIEASNTIVVTLFPFYGKGRVHQPYADLESAKLVFTDRDNSKKALEVDLEKTKAEKYLQDIKADDQVNVFLANVFDIKDVEGSFRVECQLVTKEGLLYRFEIGEVNNAKSVNDNKIYPRMYISSMGQAYPEF